MSINLTTLFADILPDPAVEAREQAKAEADLVGTNKLSALFASQAQDSQRRAAGGMFGVDTRTESEHLRDELQALGTPQTKSEHVAYADLLDKLRPGSGVQYMMQVGENENNAKDAESRRMTAEAQKASNERAGLAADEVDFSISTVSNKDGSGVQWDSKGKRHVTNTLGEEVTGMEAEAVLIAASEFAINEVAQATRGSEEARLVVATMEKATDAVNAARGNNSSLYAGLRAIDAGAMTGVFQDVLPSLSNAQVALRQVQSELGLDLIGEVTFGSLSAGELDLALNTALPTKMSEERLKEWLENKIDSNNRIMDAMTALALFLSRGGTVSEWNIEQNAIKEGRDKLVRDAEVADRVDTNDLINQLGLGGGGGSVQSVSDFVTGTTQVPTMQTGPTFRDPSNMVSNARGRQQ